VALGDLAGTLMRFGRYAETIERAEESLRLIRSAGATEHEARMIRGSIHLRRNEPDLARQYLLRAQTLLRSVGQAGATLAWTLNHLARLARREGQRQAAARYLDESLALARGIDDPEVQADALTELAVLKRDRGDAADGVGDAEAALALATGVGHPRQEMLARSTLGELLADLGRSDAAKEHFTTAMGLAMSLGDPGERDRARAGLPKRSRARGGTA
jgi:tetratricopeptide (TPR) repeat protein